MVDERQSTAVLNGRIKMCFWNKQQFVYCFNIRLSQYFPWGYISAVVWSVHSLVSQQELNRFFFLESICEFIYLDFPLGWRIFPHIEWKRISSIGDNPWLFEPNIKILAFHFFIICNDRRADPTKFICFIRHLWIQINIESIRKQIINQHIFDIRMLRG